MTTLERFESKFQKGPGCWEWQASKFPNGYGQFWYRGTNRGAHAVAYELYIGPIPEGFYGCHSCDNPLCVRPSHLFLGTPVENMADMKCKGREGRRGEWLRNPVNKRGERNSSAKLTVCQVLAIRSDGRTQQAIAHEYGISHTQVSAIKHREAWRNF